MGTTGCTWKKRPSATSISIDPDRVHGFFRRQRLPLSHASEMLGHASAWLNCCMNRGRMNYYAMDLIASEFGLNTEEIVYLFATDEERELSDRS